jgi:hypothetical protein
MIPPKFRPGEWAIWEGVDPSGGTINYRAYIIEVETGKQTGERYYAIYLPDHPQAKQMIVVEEELMSVRVRD